MRRRLPPLTFFALLLAVTVGASQAQAALGPLPDVKVSWTDTNLPPGGEGQFTVGVRNVGDTALPAGLKIVDELPAGVTATKLTWPLTDFEKGVEVCTGLGTGTVTCELDAADVLAGLGAAPGTKGGGFEAPQPTGYLPPLDIDVAIAPGASGIGTNTARVEEGGPSAEDVDQITFSETPSSFGLLAGSYEADVFSDAYPFGERVRQAGDHPFEQRVNFDLRLNTSTTTTGSEYHFTKIGEPSGLIRDAEVTLPRGMIGNPEALPKCPPTVYSENGASDNGTACPSNTQVGYINILLATRGGVRARSSAGSRVPIYNLEPPAGTPVDLAFKIGGYVQGHIYATLDPAQNYAIKSLTPTISALVSPMGAEATLWGVPGDPAHDKARFYPEEQGNGDISGAPFNGPIRPFFTNPMDCGFDNGGARIRVDSYSDPGNFTPVEEDQHPLNVTGCDDQRFRFEPEVALQPTDIHAGAPTGLDVHLEVPQRNDEVSDAKQLYAKEHSIKGIATPPIKKAVVTFPEGMTLSPSAAQGLGSCSPAQIGLGTDRPVTCPDNSQYGTLSLHTPILPIDAQPEGFIYIAKQGDNPFHNFLALYLVIEEPQRGILVKVPGRVDLDPNTGQITASFDELPQFPVSDMQMTFKGGVRAGLVEPSTCGKKVIRAEFFSWQDPGTPQVVDSSYAITQKPDGSPCVDSLGERQFKPNLEAGSVNPLAGSYSPFVFRLTRTDDDQEFSQLGVTLPPGLAAKFAGVSMCTDAAIAAAERRTGAGDGSLEQVNPSCPATSEIGGTQVGTGVGVPLTYVPGKVYLAGPYRGAPLSMVVISPAIVGPYDLGVIAVRTALRVDPKTAQGSAVSDPFPRIFQGIPVRIRDIRLKLDRQNFTLNPTSCAQKQIDAHVTGAGGNVFSQIDDTAVDLSNRFQAADCASLPFMPRLAIHLFGGTRRGAHPRLKAVLRARPGDANIAGASVALPHSEFLDQAHIKTVCTRVQFAAKACPADSVYGYAVAKTPLFDQPLQGPVYLRSSSNLLPDLVMVLRGPDAQPVQIELAGRVDSAQGGIRNTFDLVPDAPVTEFTLTMQGGKKGLLVNSTDLCARANKATAKFNGQNGRAVTLHPLVQNACRKKVKGKRARGLRRQSGQ